MKERTKLTQKQEHLEEQQIQAKTGQEFSQAEDLLRFDAARTPVPPGVTERVKQSAAQVEPPKPRPWWKAWFGR